MKVEVESEIEKVDNKISLKVWGENFFACGARSSSELGASRCSGSLKLVAVRHAFLNIAITMMIVCALCVNV